MKTYRVTAALKYPSVYDRGTEFVIEKVKNKKEAISEARAKVRRDALYDRHDGPLEYSAVEIEDQVPVFEYKEMLRIVEAAEAVAKDLDPRIGILIREGKKVYYAVSDAGLIEGPDAASVLAKL